MAKIHTLKISNFRGIKNFEQVFGDEKFICLIGRGDSGKTSILDAISFVLSPNWNLAFFDTDFFNCNIENPIIIEVSLSEPPEYLLQDNKYGMYLRGLDARNVIHDEILDAHDDILTIRLTVNKDLEPIWEVISNRQDPIEIKSSDRASLNVFLVADYIDRHFSWSKGNPLYALLKQGESKLDNANVIIDEMRKAKDQIDHSNGFGYLNETVDKVKISAAKLGFDISNATTTIDAKELNIKDGKVCLHDGNIPFRLKGKGSKRLISVSIQTELAKLGGILLIDEIEQGLEPDRAQHLASILRNNNTGQIFITTHSRDVLVELEAHNLFRVKKNSSALFPFTDDLQACLRSNPEAFFAERIIVCEGPTEVGFCRAINKSRINQGKDNITLKGIRLANGMGANQINYAMGFNSAGYDVCMFCDSDAQSINEKKAMLRAENINIIDTDQDKSIEAQIFSDLNWAGIEELINYRLTFKDVNHIRTQVAKYYPNDFVEDTLTKDTIEVREALSKASTEKEKDWFKRTDHGEFLGEVCCRHLESLKEKKLFLQIDELNKWIDNA
ncbi:ATP-dependent nuclease [Pedobacter cryoconitis]|uniref:Putative ATP-dependent endonuclease of OLD family n=1 Tax=Pedobacter cryoconitis TaxID=188932 RepID=A0A7X0J8N2_9SPHI|nr:ATP-binding protein [Pedobacter cryoconitis]MBB6503003.1 putative ATP-dependent endonuclease of OLD family [Pedobacter cryoconitis]